MEWQDISTAPKDGTGFQGYWPVNANQWAIVNCYYNPKGNHGEGFYTVDLFSDEYEHFVLPTHWMPLPQPPKA